MGEGQAGILCISSYEKGQAFLRQAAVLGCPVSLLTTEKLAGADWPRESLTGLHTMPVNLTPEQALPYITRLFRHNNYGRIVALDEFDMETASLAREHLRLPGMGQTAIRYFRDKLAMREGARRGGVAVPEFHGVANHYDLWRFMGSTGGPWLLKPRSNASAIGIQKVGRQDEVWPLLERLGDEASHHLLESFVPGEVYHVDALWWHGELKFAAAHKYGRPPMQTMHEGGVFTTRTLDRESDEAHELYAAHAKTVRALGAAGHGQMTGVTHTEFIRAHRDGQVYFLETAARVGGAFIAEVVEFASGLNPWAEWAKIEVAQLRGEEYELPSLRYDYAGSVLCLARQEHPELGSYDAAEVVYRMQKHHHAGLIVKSQSAERVKTLLDDYSARFLDEFCARMDVPDKPTS
ncbi:ATPase [Granulicella sp. 5B5]|uniref:ATP-grasp domain-containing protein n=1 Tax=Granulicella sp. 5B5 TaxID=1617967 RepID=UPI0015F53E7C|nr:ATPase [Granulicella sp. 5B5]QMV18235.1 ATPase [Granulicella sp. 5B5]